MGAFFSQRIHLTSGCQEDRGRNKTKPANGVSFASILTSKKLKIDFSSLARTGRKQYELKNLLFALLYA
ncbi:hypothetical protein A3H04_02600 [Candidatus Giovannonibacteria bacterium RIFCSPLOWO2_12_FULL_43_11c]|uniref:Uncharacterized protein n=1 Tax=Candidatus Giovannonibacteria bacterium RIFCSPHIGHO2_12_FULL_43_15 TaxID=1798341 RepID=A0A1F5WQH3_9BACT|nr:MAG: hypothetical protein A2739_02145 [Candidatus Giovannonibacteria bacterium RIFCSPHIGHO2_01_FULL_43_100]OGF77909.1 MAG: hypothetical protein A3F23_04225 [Candidatus Giovannonibacteria bacterium RIFCSPHIGHO2_12_FULL_43_15]OGF91532.1 MAG: hypothetical protein A3H04_02600 [Candidatus Giovannonibacteria bacterium RIFCSPLOWO2_12_FULL_43_11c]